MLVLGLAARTAHADDPHDLFGFDKPTAAAPAKCDDGRAFDCAIATDPLNDSVGYALSTWLPASYLLSLPVGDATHDQVAHFVGGAGRDETGPTFGGATGLENRWTIDGAPSDSVRTGANDTAIPLTFLEGMLITAGGFAARDRASTGGTIDARLLRGGDKPTLDARVWTSYTTDPAQRTLPSGEYFTRRVGVTYGEDTTVSVVGTGPIGELAGGKVWYVAGIAPNLNTTHVHWRAASVVDADGDGNPDGLPGNVATSTIENTQQNRTDYFVPLMARTGYDRGPHHLELTLIGDVSRDTSYLGNATLQATGIEHQDYVGDGIASYHGRWTDTTIDAQLAWHRSVDRQSAADPAGAKLPQLLTAYIPGKLAEDPTLAAACSAVSTVDLCPVPFGFFASGGAGALVDTVADRPTATASIAHRIGDNVLRAGATLEDARLVTDSRFTGGELIRSLFDGHTDEERYVDPNNCPPDPTKPCAYKSSSTQSYRTRYTAAYGEDTFTLQPGLVVNGGLRWELMWVGARLHFSDELAPRLGVTWDFLGNGRSRAWVSMGRAYALLPAGLGPTILSRDATVRDVTLTGIGSARSIDDGGVYRVLPDVLPVAQDELTAGIEAVYPHAIKASVWAQGRWLRRSVDTTPAGFTNPDDGLPATRDTAILTAELSTDPTAKLVLRVGYTAGITIGTTTGPYDPRQGAILYAGDDYDFGTTNLTGRLPQSLGQRVFVEASRRGHLGSLAVGMSTRLSLNSGRPRDVIGNTPDGVVDILPRGENDRGPLLTQANVELMARWRGFDVTFDIFNVFDRKDPTNVDMVYTTDSARPIDGGSYSDLVFLKNDAGKPATRSTDYLLPFAFQSPLSFTLGVRRQF